MSKSKKSSQRGASAARQGFPTPAGSRAIRDAAEWAVGKDGTGPAVAGLVAIEKVLMAHVEGRWSPGEREMPVRIDLLDQVRRRLHDARQTTIDTINRLAL